MARLILDAVAPLDAEVVVPVPLHRGRERSRGYNQAAVLARHVAAAAGLPYEAHAARRPRNTAPLVKAMGRDERLAIMRGAFMGDGQRIEGATVLLVDDVATTGATLDACAESLLDAGAATVRALTWARAD
jgi:ComF family protein